MHYAIASFCMGGCQGCIRGGCNRKPDGIEGINLVSVDVMASSCSSPRSASMNKSSNISSPEKVSISNCAIVNASSQVQVKFHYIQITPSYQPYPGWSPRFHQSFHRQLPTQNEAMGKGVMDGHTGQELPTINKSPAEVHSAGLCVVMDTIK